MCKAMAHSIQNRLLYLLSKFKGWANPKQELVANFKGYSKQETTFVCSLSTVFLRAYDALQSALGFFCIQRWHVCTFAQQPSFRYRLVAVNLIDLENASVLFCCSTPCTSHNIYLEGM